MYAAVEQHDCTRDIDPKCTLANIEGQSLTYDSPVVADHAHIPADIMPNFLALFDGNHVEINSILPEGISIGMGPYGRNLTATKHFPAGSILYRGYAALVKYVANKSKDENTKERKLDDNNNDKKYTLHVFQEGTGKLLEKFLVDDTHSVQDFAESIHVTNKINGNSMRADEACEDIRQVYGFDCFMNHSCTANTFSANTTREGTTMGYDTVACRDIDAGEEITCDYALFDYECNGHEITKCECMSSKCRGLMLGFKGMSFEDQVSNLHRCEKEIRDLFFLDNPDLVLLNSDLPAGVEVYCDESNSYSCLKATRMFHPEEIIFTNTCQIFDKNELFGKSVIVKVGDQYFPLDVKHHFIHRPNYLECIGFDSFMDHSCDPNTTQTYENATDYTVKALKIILPGEKLTCDYALLENQAEKLGIIPMTKFECFCGSYNCKKILFA